MTSHTINLHTLEELESGDWSRVCVSASEDWDTYGRPELTVYDDDTIECVCDEEWCTKWPDNLDDWLCDCGEINCMSSHCKCGNRDCTKVSKVKHQKVTQQDHRGLNKVITLHGNGSRLIKVLERTRTAAMPEEFQMPDTAYGVGRQSSILGGWIYALAFNPDLSLHRLKIGWSSDLVGRMKTYSTAAPGQLLLGAWEADENEESIVLSRASKSGLRVGGEVYDIQKPFEWLNTIQEELYRDRERRGTRTLRGESPLQRAIQKHDARVLAL